MKSLIAKPEEVRAILAGATKFWRAIKPQPDEDGGIDACNSVHDHNILELCPYQVGEVLWIKEKALYWEGGAGGTSDVVYSDDPDVPQLIADNSTLLVERETTNILAGEGVVGK